MLETARKGLSALPLNVGNGAQGTERPTRKCFERNGRSPEYGTVPTKPTPVKQPVVYKVQVRELVDFVLRRGDLGSERDFMGPHRALAGIRGHQKLQRSR